MVGPRHTSLASEQLRAACAAELSILNVTPDAVITAEAAPTGWRLTVTIDGRTFRFGTLHSVEFRFVEVTPEREVDLVAALPPTSQAANVLWPYAFWLLQVALRSSPGQLQQSQVI